MAGTGIVHLNREFHAVFIKIGVFIMIENNQNESVFYLVVK